MVWEIFPGWWYIVHIRPWLDLTSDGYVQVGLWLVMVDTPCSTTHNMCVLLNQQNDRESPPNSADHSTMSSITN